MRRAAFVSSDGCDAGRQPRSPQTSPAAHFADAERQSAPIRKQHANTAQQISLSPVIRSSRRRAGSTALSLRLCVIEPELRAIDLGFGGVVQRLLPKMLPRTIDVELLGREQFGL